MPVSASGMRAPIRVGTRGSALALIQSQSIAQQLQELSGVRAECVVVSTLGDRSPAPLAQLGGTGVFTSALRQALLAGEVDVLVHSLKDLPTTPEPSMIVAAVPPREDPRDLLCMPDLGGASGSSLRRPGPAGGAALSLLLEGARVGTGSPRRAAFVRATRPDVQIVDIRGNVPTRLGRLDAAHPESVDALVLAAAGVKRLAGGGAQLAERVRAEQLPLELCLPAAGQGALGVEIRSDAPEFLRAWVGALDDAPTRLAVAAERAVVRALGAGCTTPLGAHATRVRSELRLLAAVAAADGSRVLQGSVNTTVLSHDGAYALGERLAAQLVGQGAQELL